MCEGAKSVDKSKCGATLMPALKPRWLLQAVVARGTTVHYSLDVDQSDGESIRRCNACDNNNQGSRGGRPSSIT